MKKIAMKLFASDAVVGTRKYGEPNKFGVGIVTFGNATRKIKRMIQTRNLMTKPLPPDSPRPKQSCNIARKNDEVKARPSMWC